MFTLIITYIFPNLALSLKTAQLLLTLMDVSFEKSLFTPLFMLNVSWMLNLCFFSFRARPNTTDRSDCILLIKKITLVLSQEKISRLQQNGILFPSSLLSHEREFFLQESIFEIKKKKQNTV